MREYEIFSDKITKEHKIVFLTDLHDKVYRPDNQPIIDEMKKIDPELVIVGGDMITGSTARKDSDGWALHAWSFLDRVNKEFSLWLCNGNHELKIEDPLNEEYFGGCYPRYEGKLRDLGILVHRNCHEPFPGDPGIELWNFEPDHIFFRKFHDHKVTEEYVEEKIGKSPDPEKFNLLITHHPLHFEPCAQWGADLVLSGHIHGGIMRLPLIGGVVSPDPALFPYYTGGRYELALDKDNRILEKSGRVYSRKHSVKAPENGRKSLMVLSCGIGFHTIPIRIFNPAEISVIYLRPQRKA